MPASVNPGSPRPGSTPGWALRATGSHAPPWCCGSQPSARCRRRRLGSRIWGKNMGSEGARLAESERAVWFWLKRYSICTPHSNRKYELILFWGGKPILLPNFGAQAGGRAAAHMPRHARRLCTARHRAKMLNTGGPRIKYNKTHFTY